MDGGRGIRVHQDPLTSEQALTANAEAFGLTDTFTSLALSRELVAGAKVVLLRLPRSLDALRDIAGIVAAHAAPDVTVFAGGRIKHMTPAMNEVPSTTDSTVSASRSLCAARFRNETLRIVEAIARSVLRRPAGRVLVEMLHVFVDVVGAEAALVVHDLPVGQENHPVGV